MGPAPSLLRSVIPLHHLTAMLGAHAAATGLGPADTEIFLPSAEMQSGILPQMQSGILSHPSPGQCQAATASGVRNTLVITSSAGKTGVGQAI